MRFKQYINEESKKGWGITYVDIDDTVFKTFAKIYVMKNNKIIKKLDNQEFNSYVLKEDEYFDFREFRDAKHFNETSIPIEKTVKRIKKMLSRIKKTDSKSMIVFLTARADFDDKNTFLKTFENHGIKMDKPNVYVERTGNIKTGTVDEKKKKVMLDYLKKGVYRRVRLLDDHKPNLKALLDIKNNLPEHIENKVRLTYNLDDNEEAIKFWSLWVDDNGNLQEYKG